MLTCWSPVVGPNFSSASLVVLAAHGGRAVPMVVLELEVPEVQSGPVAQLGARLNGIQEVTGSIPVRSTNSKSLILND